MSFEDNLKFESGYISYRKSEGSNAWDINITFKPFEYKDLKVHPHIGFDEAQLGTDQSADLVGKTFSWDEKYFNSGAGASFYTFEHDYLKYFKIHFVGIERDMVKAQMETIIDFLGFDDDDSNRSMKLNIDVELQIK